MPPRGVSVIPQAGPRPWGAARSDGLLQRGARRHVPLMLPASSRGLGLTAIPPDLQWPWHGPQGWRASARFA